MPGFVNPDETESRRDLYKDLLSHLNRTVFGEESTLPYSPSGKHTLDFNPVEAFDREKNPEGAIFAEPKVNLTEASVKPLRTAALSELIPRIKDKFSKAYEVAKESSGGGSWVDIAVLRDQLGLKQEKMAGLLKKAQSKGHALLELGEPSVSSEYLKGGMIDDKMLVKLDPEFFNNISQYIKQMKE